MLDSLIWSERMQQHYVTIGKLTLSSQSSFLFHSANPFCLRYFIFHFSSCVTSFTAFSGIPITFSFYETFTLYSNKEVVLLFFIYISIRTIKINFEALLNLRKLSEIHSRHCAQQIFLTWEKKTSFSHGKSRHISMKDTDILIWIILIGKYVEKFWMMSKNITHNSRTLWCVF